ncbi:MAG TPA: serine hydrolase domain-containing protein [Actinomycetota bacterium]|jgi:CubicO group peptidase (beta-lactamase class C family)
MGTARGPVDAPGGRVSRRRVLAAGALGVAAPILSPAARWAGAAPRSERRLDLDAEIRGLMRAGHAPGLAACIVKDGGIAWARGYGHANLAHDRRATSDTIFMLASISKTVMAVAAMQAVEAGLLDLDADVDDVLPFPVRNPRHPDDAITLRTLLTHTSGIRDDWPTIVPFYTQGDSPIALGDYLRRYLVPGGDLYHPHRNYAPWRPGQRYEYGNIAASLAGYLVEAASGTPFDAWCETRIFSPLAMDRTAWHLEGLDRTEIAMPYRWGPAGYAPYGQYGYPDYPDGQLRTSARQLARHLLAFIGGGAYGDARLLAPETVAEMRRVQFPGVAHGQGLIWYRFGLRGMRLMGHNGGDDGVATQMYFRLDDGVGVIALANGDWHRADRGWPLQRIAIRLFEEADRI